MRLMHVENLSFVDYTCAPCVSHAPADNGRRNNSCWSFDLLSEPMGLVLGAASEKMSQRSAEREKNQSVTKWSKLVQAGPSAALRIYHCFICAADMRPF